MLARRQIIITLKNIKNLGERLLLSRHRPLHHHHHRHNQNERDLHPIALKASLYRVCMDSMALTHISNHPWQISDEKKRVCFFIRPDQARHGRVSISRHQSLGIHLFHSKSWFSFFCAISTRETRNERLISWEWSQILNGISSERWAWNQDGWAMWQTPKSQPGVVLSCPSSLLKKKWVVCGGINLRWFMGWSTRFHPDHRESVKSPQNQTSKALWQIQIETRYSGMNLHMSCFLCQEDEDLIVKSFNAERRKLLSIVSPDEFSFFEHFQVRESRLEIGIWESVFDMDLTHAYCSCKRAKLPDFSSLMQRRSHFKQSRQYGL